MKKQKISCFSKIVSFVLIAAMALSLCSCAKKGEEKTADSAQTVTSSAGVTELGNGKTQFYFNVYDKSGNKTPFVIHTDEKTVGDALVKLKLIEGTQGNYGLMVTKVNGITADYNADKYYWAFYVDGKYADSGVDTTDITENATYEFKAEK